MKNRTLMQSFRNAFNGLFHALRNERNLWIHMGAIVLVIVLGLILKLEPIRWALLICAIGFVVITELLNTAIERLTDMVTSEYCEKARLVKDIAAGAVLVGAILAVVIGLFVFFKPILTFLGWI
jgi:diacylglycerol kinase